MRSLVEPLRSIGSFHAMFVRRPALALVAIPICFIAVLFIGFGTILLVTLAEDRLGPRYSAALPIGLILAAASIIAICLDLLLIQVLAVASGIRLGSNRAELLRIAQAVLVTIVVYAIVYYYIHLFSRNSAFRNLSPAVVKPSRPLPNAVFFYQAILHVPSVDEIIDCLYFSVITITTVGYGDIYPVAPYAKLVCASEIVLGYLLLVLSIGAIASSPEKLSRTRPRRRIRRPMARSAPRSAPASGRSAS